MEANVGRSVQARILRALGQYALMAVLLLVLAVFLLYPIGLTVRGGFARDIVTGQGWTLEHLALLFKDSVIVEGLLNSAKLATGTTLLAMLIAVPLALIAATYKFPGKTFFNAAVLVPLILPPFVGALGTRAILGREGALNALLGTDWDVLGDAKFWGVVVVQALSLYPIIYLNATAALANLDPALGEAAENLGASWRRRLLKITLPLVRPGLFAGATIVFIWSFTELGTPLMFDYYSVTPVRIFFGIKEVEASAEPYALTVVLLAAAVGMYILGKLVFGGKAYAMYSKASRASGEVELTGLKGWLAAGAFGLVSLIAVTPHLGVVLMSFTSPGQWYQSVLPKVFTTSHYMTALTDQDSFGSIRNSLFLASSAMAFNILLGILIAYVIVRTTIRGRGLLDALCMLPLAVPGLVMAFGYVAMSLSWPFGKGDPLDGVVSVLGADPNPIPLLIIAYAIRRLPYIVRSAVAGLEQTSGELEEAAVNLGASRVTAVRKVIVPLIMANLIAGGLLVFAFSMLEVSDSLILAQQAKNYPVTRAIFSFTERLGDGPYIASAMGVWGMALLTVTLFAASVLLGKKLGSIFRV
ncbi:MAG: iron ABC transporter permease [Planctomycetota bacterium]|nr:iron ABC transporter permease [Planctomycetota bacterium]